MCCLYTGALLSYLFLRCLPYLPRVFRKNQITEDNLLIHEIDKSVTDERQNAATGKPQGPILLALTAVNHAT